MEELIRGLLTGTIRAGTPVLYGTLGEILSERAGIVNLGVEGSMIMGACVGFLVTALTQQPLLGVLLGALAGGLLSLVHAVFVITLRANQIASGLAVMFLGLGISGFIGRPYVGVKIPELPALPIPLLSQIPLLGPVLFQHDLLTYANYVLVPLLWFVLFYTRWGLRLRATGERQTVAYAAGIPTRRVQYLAVLAGGVLSGLGGTHLSLAYTGVWVEGMTAGRGFVAVALVIFAAWNPLRGVIGAFLFGGAVAFQLQLQARGAAVSSYILDMLPYVLTLLVLLVWGRGRRYAMPEGLKAVFESVR
jgi:simple sugar transport system permease protein